MLQYNPVFQVHCCCFHLNHVFNHLYFSPLFVPLLKMTETTQVGLFHFIPIIIQHEMQYPNPTEYKHIILLFVNIATLQLQQTRLPCLSFLKTLIQKIRNEGHFIYYSYSNAKLIINWTLHLVAEGKQDKLFTIHPDQ